MTKRESKREPTSTAERITQARNKMLGRFQPWEPRTIHYALDDLSRFLDGEDNPEDGTVLEAPEEPDLSEDDDDDGE